MKNEEIEKLRNEMHADVDKKINQLLESIKPVIVVGNWYTNGTYLLNYQLQMDTYGFKKGVWDSCSAGKWNYSKEGLISDGFKLADEMEVFQALKKHAEENGLVKGAKIRYINNNFTALLIDTYYSLEDGVFYCGDVTLMENGKWAEKIVKTIEDWDEEYHQSDLNFKEFIIKHNFKLPE